MHSDYADIRSRIAEEPTWYSLGAVPRYGQPPEDVLPFMGRIRCQVCEKEFWVCLVDEVYKGLYGQTMSFTPAGSCPENPGEYHGKWTYQAMGSRNGPQQLPENWTWGDPPRHDCVGDTMTCEEEWCWEDE